MNAESELAATNLALVTKTAVISLTDHSGSAKVTLNVSPPPAFEQLTDPAGRQYSCLGA